jgi:hypothetical protein
MRFLFLIFLTFISCSSENNEMIQVLSFKNCKVSYPQFSKGEKVLYEGHSISNEWYFESAKTELASCLCEKYLQNPDEETKVKILEIFKAKEEYFSKAYPKNLPFDSILKHRKEIFDYKILID